MGKIEKDLYASGYHACRLDNSSINNVRGV